MQVISRTHVGLVRENNEDALLVREPSLLPLPTAWEAMRQEKLPAGLLLKPLRLQHIACAMSIRNRISVRLCWRPLTRLIRTFLKWR